MFELKKSTAVDCRTEVLSGRSLRKELFSPERQENKDTDDLVKIMASIGAKAVLKELHDPKKHSWEHLDSQDGPLSWKKVTDEMKKASLGKNAVNDVSERPFGGMTHQLESFTTLSGSNASAVAQARINGDFNRAESELRTKTKTKEDKHCKNGIAIDLPSELLQTAIEFAMMKTKEVRKTDQEALTKQQEHRAEKIQALKLRGIENATQQLIDCFYYYDMYHSLRCWRTPEVVDEMLNKLKSNTAKLNEIKEQIRMRELGLGWVEARHAWSKNGRAYTVDELATHLKEVILPEEVNRNIPSEPPVQTLERKVLPVLGTLSANVAKLDVASGEKEQEMREAAVRMRDERELEGVGDRYEQMQPTIPPVLDESLLNRRLEICEYRGDNLHWHSGTVLAVLMKPKQHVQFQFDADVLDEGEDPIQRVKLLPTFWNKTKHTKNAKGWRLAKEEIELARPN